MSKAEEQKILIKTKHNNYGSQDVVAINGGESGSSSSSSSSLIPSASESTSTPPLDDCGPFEPDQMKSTLTFLQKCGFGLGHIYNDLCAGVWFSYTLLFLQNVLLMEGTVAGALVMLGQVGDALATPVIGVLADKYGTKRKWHIAGTGLVFLSFPLIFAICPGCGGEAPKWWPPTYFSIVILSFQLGWAIVQITHLAMIPEMSRTRKDRADLTAIRYSASVCSNVIVYCVTWAVLRTRSNIDKNIGPKDAIRFRDISLILTLIGIYMSVCFHFSLSWSGYGRRRRQALNNGGGRRSSNDVSAAATTAATTAAVNDDERRLLEAAAAASTTATALPPPKKKNFLKSPLLYQNTFLYVFSRLFMTTSLIYIPLWLDERTRAPLNDAVGPTDDSKNVIHIATVPLMSFTASFVSSMAMKYSNRLFGHKVAYLLGSLASVSACVWVALAANIGEGSYRLYAIAILFGAGSSVTMISSLCITADMIGRHADQSGFIYSAVTFADKLITGVAVIVIEALKCNDRQQCPEYYRNVLAYACGGAAIFGAVTLATLQLNRQSQRNLQRRRHTEAVVTTAGSSQPTT